MLLIPIDSSSMLVGKEPDPETDPWVVITTDGISERNTNVVRFSRRDLSYDYPGVFALLPM